MKTFSVKKLTLNQKNVIFIYNFPSYTRIILSFVNKIIRMYDFIWYAYC